MTASKGVSMVDRIARSVNRKLVDASITPNMLQTMRAIAMGAPLERTGNGRGGRRYTINGRITRASLAERMEELGLIGFAPAGRPGFECADLTDKAKEIL